VRSLDITELTCPMTWVRTKLELERMAAGEALEVRCRPGEALENVPRSAREAGHAVSVEGNVIRIVRASPSGAVQGAQPFGGETRWA
jgi:TusA-related sulfurtransferase